MAKMPKNKPLGSSSLEVTFGRAEALYRKGDLVKAAAFYTEIIEADPCHHRAANGLGQTLAAQNALGDAEYMFAHAVSVDPTYMEAHVNRGRVLLGMGQPLKALTSFDAALAIDASAADAGLGRAYALLTLERFEEAAAAFDRWADSEPDDYAVHFNRSLALKGALRLDEAIAGFERALAIKPDAAVARLNKAQCLLTKGDFEAGWAEFESRWAFFDSRPTKDTDGIPPRRKLAQPLWLGDADLSGKTLLVTAEQGFGDMLQFCRYVPLLPKDARVVLEIPEPLCALMAKLEGVDEICVRGKPLPDFDFHCPFMSLPLALRATVAGIPANVPYLAAESQAIARWADALGLTESASAPERSARRPRVGLVWSGRPTHANDRHRSIRLETFGKVLSADATFVSLQQELRKRDRPYLDAHPEIRYLGAKLQSFGDTAAVLSLMDLVITVDTSVAHLAGAMGKPLWVLVPASNSDWRWMLDREDSPWYPTARLFRQDREQGWEPTLQRVAEELGRFSP